MNNNQSRYFIKEAEKNNLLINSVLIQEKKKSYNQDNLFRQISDVRSTNMQGGTGVKNNGAESMGERMQRDIRELYTEYVNENEKEVPAIGSRIIYQCLHPLQDLVQNAYTHLVHEDSHFERDKLDPHRKLYSQSYSNYEYMLILEEISEPKFDPNSSKTDGLPSYPVKLNLVPTHSIALNGKNLIQESNRNTTTEFKRIEQNQKRLTSIQNDDFSQQSFVESEIEFEKDESINRHAKNAKHQSKATTYEHRSWIAECSYKHSNEPERENSFFGEDQSRKLFQNQMQIETTTFETEPDQTNQEDSGPLTYQRYVLNMCRLDLQTKTQLLISQQSFTIWDQDAQILNNRFHFSVDGSLLYLILKCSKTDSILNTISLDSLSLKNLDTYDIDMTKISTVIKARDLQGEPVLYLPKSFQQHEERKTSKFILSQISQPSCLLLYLQDSVNGNLIVKEGQNYQQLEFPLKQQSLMYQESSYYLQTQYQIGKILNIFFGVSTGGEIDDSMIILQEYINKDMQGQIGEVSIFKTQIMNVKAILEYMQQYDDGEQVSLFDLSGMSRPTDFTIEEIIPINLGQLKIKRSFYHKQVGIVIEMSEIVVDQTIQQFLEPTELDKKTKLILLPQSKLYQKFATSLAKVLCFNSLQLPINPQLQSKLCFIENAKGRDYMIFFEDFIYNKGSIEQTLQNGNFLDLGSQVSDEHQSYANGAQSHYVDFISNFDFQKKLSFTRIDMEPLDEHTRRPILNFYSKTDDILNDSKRLEGTQIHINEPYIITVVNQSMINIYSMINSKQIYTLKLERHFEFFLEVSDDEIWIGKDKYYKHQVVLFQILDLKSNAHRIQALILPSYPQMTTQSPPFKLLTLPFKLHMPKDQFRRDDGQIQQIQMSADDVVVAHFLQLREPNHFKDNMMEDKSSTVWYNQARNQAKLLIQLVDKIVLYDFIGESSIGQVLAENCTADHKMIRVKDCFGKIREHVCDLKSSIKPDDSHNSERLKDIVGDPKFFYFLSSEQGTSHINLLHINFPELLSTEQVLTLTAPLLEFEISHSDIEQTSLILLDQNFCLQTYSPSFSKLSNLSLVLKKASPQLLLAQNQWILLKAQDAKIQCNVKRHIKITDDGVYIDDKYYRIQKDAMADEFEQKREKTVSSKLKGGKEDVLVYLNESGVIDSGAGCTNVYYYRKIKQINNAIQLANRAGRIMLSKKNSYVAAKINQVIQELTVNQQQPASFYFLALPDLTYRKKYLLPQDSFGQKELDFSSFIGDDILIKCGNQFLIFNLSGSLIPITQEVYSNMSNILLSEYKLKQLIQCEINDGTFKLLLIHQRLQLLTLLTLTKQNFNNSYSLRYDISAEPLMPKVEDRSVVVSKYISVIKLNQRGQLIRMFVLKNIEREQQGKARGATIQLFRRITLQAPLNANNNNDSMNQVIIYIGNQRQGALEQKIREIIEQEFHLDKSKGQQKKVSKKKLNRFSNSQSTFEKKSMIRLSSTDEPPRNLSNMNNVLERNEQLLLLGDNLDEEDQSGVLTQIEFKEHDIDLMSIEGEDRFIVKVKNNLHLVSIENSTKLELNLNSNGIITQILPIQKSQHFQFMYYDNTTKNFHLFKWDLKNNQEQSMYIFKQNSHNPFYVVTRGVTVNDNYLFFIGQNSYQDLRLNFPSNQFQGQVLWPQNLQYNPKCTSDERLKFILENVSSVSDDVKMSRDSKKCLGMLKGLGLAEVHRSYSFIDLQYIKYLQWKFQVQSIALDSKKDSSKIEIELENLRIMFPLGLNFLHYFATEVEFLKLFLTEINEPEKKKNAKDFIYYPLHPSTEGLPISSSIKARRPLSLALKTNSSQCFELQIQILQSQLQKGGHSSNVLCILDHLKPYLQNLLIWKSPFVRSLVATRCHHYLFSIKVEGEKFKNKDVFQEMTTMYVDENRVKELSQGGIINSKKPKNREPEDVQKNYTLKTIKTSDFANQVKEFQDIKQNEGIESEDDMFTEKAIKNQNKRQIFFYAYDFSGLLDGPKAESFLRFLISQKENLSIFELKYIQAYLNYRWNAIKRPYFILLIMIILKIIMMLFYIISQDSLIDCYYSNSNQGLEQEYNCSQSIYLRMREFQYWDDTNFVIQLILLVVQCYVTHKEMTKFLKIRTFTQALVLFFNYLHIIKLLADKLLLTIFTQIVLDFNLQQDFSSGYFNNIDKRYQDRYATFYIYIIKFGNALLMITLPLIFFYKIRFQMFITLSLPRFFMAAQKVLQLILIFAAMYICLYYSYSIIDSMRYFLGDLQEDSVKAQELLSLEYFVQSMRIVNATVRLAIFSLIGTVIVVMFHFLGTTISRADSQSTNNVELEKYRNLASLLLEDTSFLQTQSNSSEKQPPTRYVIQAQVESSQTMSRGDKKAHDNEKQQQQQQSVSANEEIIKIMKEMLAEERKEIAKMIKSSQKNGAVE